VKWLFADQEHISEMLRRRGVVRDAGRGQGGNHPHSLWGGDHDARPLLRARLRQGPRTAEPRSESSASGARSWATTSTAYTTRPEARDQACVICFLASRDADFVTGVTIDVTGGI